MPASLSKAVFPCAGLGTRFLPATKAQPKEMLTLVDKPLIQYGVEEALGAEIPDIIVITSRGKSSIEDHFDFSPELEAALEEKGNVERLAEVKAISDLINICFVRQKRALGLGHAVNCARDVVGNEPFAVVLPDDIIMSRVPVLKQMKRVHQALGASVLALMEVPRERIGAYGVVEAEPHPYEGAEGRLYKLRGMVEKPKPEDAPSNLAIIGRYILLPEIFGYLDKTKTGAGGELQLTDGLRNMLADMPMYGYVFEGTRYDAGDKFGYLEATIDYALAHPELGGRFRELLRCRDF
ncbi:MAG: UTP--glucose-1-phosphate uridylyltransferase GalU [Bryobacterales bacterium]|nr:UTP--glucose-1-phosphate uridylyltransferase GalU [Bryobacterales bacterium]